MLRPTSRLMDSSSGSITPVRTVKFTWSGHTIGSATLNSSGVVSLTKSNLNADSYPLTAVYLIEPQDFRRHLSLSG